MEGCNGKKKCHKNEKKGSKENSKISSRGPGETISSLSISSHHFLPRTLAIEISFCHGLSQKFVT